MEVEMMKIAKYLSFLGFIIMSTAIISGFIYGDFTGEGGIIISLLWGKVTLIDIYLMFLIFSGWVYFREANFFKFLIWFILILVFGAATACLYLYLAFQSSNGDWNQFFTGKSKKNIQNR